MSSSSSSSSSGEEVRGVENPAARKIGGGERPRSYPQHDLADLVYHERIMSRTPSTVSENKWSVTDLGEACALYSLGHTFAGFKVVSPNGRVAFLFAYEGATGLSAIRDHSERYHTSMLPVDAFTHFAAIKHLKGALYDEKQKTAAK